MSFSKESKDNCNNSVYDRVQANPLIILKKKKNVNHSNIEHTSFNLNNGAYFSTELAYNHNADMADIHIACKIM